MIKLRPHHMFCTTLFSGHGYDDDFTQNMKDTIKRFETEKIVLVQGKDDICKKCPHMTETGYCKNGMDNVITRDKNSLTVLDFETGATFTRQELFAKLEKITETDFNCVCHHCKWGTSGLCSFEQLQDFVQLTKR
ncbi:MAG: DUF1284 domain-containing protein [Clostridia bacterium]